MPQVFTTLLQSLLMKYDVFLWRRSALAGVRFAIGYHTTPRWG